MGDLIYVRGGIGAHNMSNGTKINGLLGDGTRVGACAAAVVRASQAPQPHMVSGAQRLPAAMCAA